MLESDLQTTNCQISSLVMDHISILLQSDYSLDEVPYLGWDNPTGSFESLGPSYACETVHDLLQLRDSEIESKVQIFQKVVQSWLYFDLLKDVFPDKFKIEDFVSGSEVSSRALIDYCSSSTHHLAHNHEKKHKTLQFAAAVVNYLDAKWYGDERDSLIDLDGHRNGHDYRSQSQLIVCSVKVLIETLSCFLQGQHSTSSDLPVHRTSTATRTFKFFASLFFVDLPDSNANRSEAQNASKVDSEDRSVNSVAAYYLARKMMQKGSWCPSRLAKIRNRVDSICLYLYLVKGHNLKLRFADHEECRNHPKMDNDDIPLCRLDNLPDEYNPKHASGCPEVDCELISVSTQELNEVYKNRQVNTWPILVCSMDGGMRVEPYVSQEYYAISHVWSEGLGNRTANAIFRCQVRDIMRQVRQTRQAQHHPPHSVSHASNEVCIWLDTLCIPPRHDSQSTLELSGKTLAIQKIDLIFASATSVVVRESTLRDDCVDFFNLGPLKQAMYLQNMVWLSRCWTLAEAIAAWKLYLPIGGRSVELRELIENIKASACDVTRDGARAADEEVENHVPDPKLRQLICDHAVTSLLHSVDAFGNGHEGKNELIKTWNILCDRSTTNSDDIPGILAMANAISPKDIVIHPPRTEDRIKAILNAFPALPTSFLFQRGDKLVDKKPNQWIPAKLLTERLATSSEVLRTYREGKMVGPLSTDLFPTYFFPCGPSTQFYLNIPQTTEQAPREIHVELNDPLPGRHRGVTPSCLVLPNSFISKKFLRPSSCTAFCATVEDISEGHMRSLVRWETTAKVSITPRNTRQSGIPSFDASDMPKRWEVYIACGMYRGQYQPSI